MVQHNKTVFFNIAVNDFYYLPYLVDKYGPGATKHAPTFRGSSGN
jgi:hypothetical protein